MHRSILPCFLLAAASGCTPTLQRSIPYEPILEPRTNTLWIVEVDEQASEDARVLVIVCHREARPACMRISPPDARDKEDYVRWLDTLPADVRRMASLPGPAADASEAPAVRAP